MALMQATDRAELARRVKAHAHEVGFDLVGISTIGPATHPDAFRRWLAAGHHRPMDKQLLFAGSLVGRIPLDMIKRNAALIAGRILRVARGAPTREALDVVARNVAPQDLSTLRAAVEPLLEAPAAAVREAAIWALAQ